jgi:hypothetical protein
VSLQVRHREERSDDAIQGGKCSRWIASLSDGASRRPLFAMTPRLDDTNYSASG